jgi:phenylpyruvate tautomerase PptA (4-oxalocrotonate tautomerase family)
MFNHHWPDAWDRKRTLNFQGPFPLARRRANGQICHWNVLFNAKYIIEPLTFLLKGTTLAIVRVDYPKDKPTGYGTSLANTINSTMQKVLGVPPQENYVICQEHDRISLFHAPEHCPPERLEQIVFIQITLNKGRSPELKDDFFRTLTQSIASSSYAQAENVFINLVEVARENWSFGKSVGPKSA